MKNSFYIVMFIWLTLLAIGAIIFILMKIDYIFGIFIGSFLGSIVTSEIWKAFK